MATSQPGEVLRHLRRALLLRDPIGMTDSQLLECLVSDREEAALAAIVRRHGPMVWGVCRRLLGDHPAAADVFRAIFATLARRAGSVRPRQMLADWLYGVAYQTARGRSWEHESPGEGHLLDEALSRLSAADRVVLILCDLEGMTQEDAARQLGMQVTERLVTARAVLAKRLSRHGQPALAEVLSQEAARSRGAVLPAIATMATAPAEPAKLMPRVVLAVALAVLAGSWWGYRWWWVAEPASQAHVEGPQTPVPDPPT
jgi:DNA-directed RNA polymerase specialized sigma24 family protein